MMSQPSVRPAFAKRRAARPDRLLPLFLMVFGSSSVAADLRPPLPVWPSDSETITQREPVFRINGRFGTTQYRVELARSAKFSEPVQLTEFRVAEAEGIEPVVLVGYRGKPLEYGEYFWRAFCRGTDGGWTPPANYRRFVVADKLEPLNLPSELSHPRLLIDAAGVEAFRERLSRSEHLQRGWQYLENAATSLLDTAPLAESYARMGPGQHAYYNIVAEWYRRHLNNLAFVAYLTRNRQLTQKGVELLMAAVAYERWLGPFFDDRRHFDPPWHAALETAMMTEAVAVAYDLLYDALDDAQRRIVRRALLEKGIRPLIAEWADPIGSSRLPRHQLPNSNWVMVCSAGAGAAALALLGEDPDAAEAVRLVRNRVRAWLADRGGDYCADGTGPTNGPKPIVGPSEPNFGPDGGYKESITYMNYAMRYVCCFAEPLKRLTGEDLFALFPRNLLEPVTWSVLVGTTRGRSAAA